MPFVADQRVRAYAAVPEPDFGMAARAEGFHGRDAAHDLEAGGRHIHQEPRWPVLGARDHDGEIGPHGARDEPLVAIDDPVVSVAAGLGAQHARVGACTGCRLGHGEAGLAFAAPQRLQIALALSQAGQRVQRKDIGLRGWGAAQRGRAQKAAAGLFEVGAAFGPAERQAAVLEPRARLPQAARTRQGMQLGGHTFVGFAVVCRLQVFTRDDLGVDEIAQGVDQCGVLRFRAGSHVAPIHLALISLTASAHCFAFSPMNRVNSEVPM